MTLFQSTPKNGFRQRAGLLATVLFVALLAACGNGKIGINKLQVGEKNSGEAFVGLPLPVKADIRLEENISSVELLMSSIDTEDEWSFSQDFTEKYGGAGTAAFNENFGFPSGTETGNYELSLTVKGESGTVLVERRNIHISVDSSVPMIDELEVGINSAGDDLHLAAHIEAPRKIKRVTLTVDGTDWSKEYVFEQDRIKDQMSIHFHEHAHVDEAPAGEYLVILTVEDQEGRKASSSSSFRKQ